ncbi:MAG: hypothetical protein AW07_03684 [Candidatus Accumulibacter sp. SK-11]|nr:MAG: hypothetical protein AW07_03684 [Candidatus Accumulibacter sp. SK-11]
MKPSTDQVLTNSHACRRSGETWVSRSAMWIVRTPRVYASCAQSSR